MELRINEGKIKVTLAVKEDLVKKMMEIREEM